MTHQESKGELTFSFMSNSERSHLFFNSNQPELSQEPGSNQKKEPKTVKTETMKLKY